MKPAVLIQNLLKVGTATKAAFEEARRGDGEIDWSRFVASDAFQELAISAQTLLGTLGREDISAAVERVREKQQELLDGRSVSELPIDELLQFGALADVESLLVTKEIQMVGHWEEFLGWLKDRGLTTLAQVVKLVVPLLR